MKGSEMKQQSVGDVFSKLGRVSRIETVSSGTPTDVVLTPGDTPFFTISAVMALARRGVLLCDGKRAVEVCCDKGRAELLVPMMEEWNTFKGDLERAGFAVSKAGC